MRPAFTLLGLMTLVVFVGAFIALSRKVEAPEQIQDNKGNINKNMTLKLTSPTWGEGGRIPAKYTCDGENVSPELHIENVPEGTKSFALVMDDPDIPDSVKQARGIEKFDHWVLYNILPETQIIEEGEMVGTAGLNSSGKAGYVGACPPDREHRYFFRLYALRGTLNFLQTPNMHDVEEAAHGMMLDEASLMGRYERTKIAQ